jgi:hypothetical protein
MPTTPGTASLSPPDLEYLQGFEVVTVLEWLTSGLVLDKPQDPIVYMRDALAGIAARRHASADQAPAQAPCATCGVRPEFCEHLNISSTLFFKNFISSQDCCFCKGC